MNYKIKFIKIKVFFYILEISEEFQFLSHKSSINDEILDFNETNNVN